MRWNRVNVDLWGPKLVVNVNGYTYKLHIMTMVDSVTGWFEQRQFYYPPNAFTSQQILDSVWLSRYPCSKEIGFDNGSKFKMEFQDLCANIGLKKCPSNSWNPQSNAILEQIHQVLADVIVTFNLDRTRIDEDKED